VHAANWSGAPRKRHDRRQGRQEAVGGYPSIRAHRHVLRAPSHTPHELHHTTQGPKPFGDEGAGLGPKQHVGYSSTRKAPSGSASRSYRAPTIGLPPTSQQFSAPAMPQTVYRLSGPSCPR
jgi:hypothetical protein